MNVNISVQETNSTILIIAFFINQNLPTIKQKMIVKPIKIFKDVKFHLLQIVKPVIYKYHLEKFLGRVLLL